MTEILNPALRDEYVTMGGGNPQRDFSYLPNGASSTSKEAKSLIPAQLMGSIGVLASVVWLTVAALLTQKQWIAIAAGDMNALSGVVVLAFAPVMLVWIIVMYAQRGADHKATLVALRRLGQQATTPVDKAEARLMALNEATERQVKMLADAANMAAGRIDQARQSLRHETEALTAVSARSAGEVERLTGFLRDGAQIVDRVVGQVSDQAGRLEGQTRDMIISLERYAGEVCSKIERSNEALMNTADGTHLALGQISNRIESRYAEINNMAQSLIGQLERSGTDLADRMVAFEETVAWSERLVERVGEPLGQHTQGLKVATVQAVKAMRAANSMMEEQLSRYRAIGAQAAADTNSAQQIISQQVSNYEQAARHALAVSFEAQQAAEKRIADLDDASQSLVEKIAYVTEEMKVSTVDLGTVAERSIGDIAATVANRFDELRSEVEGAVNMLGAVAHEATTASERVIEASRSLSDAARDAEGQADNLSAVEVNVTNQLRSLERVLADRVYAVDAVIDRSAEIAQSIDERVSVVVGKIDGSLADVQMVTGNLVDKMSQSRREITEEFGKNFDMLHSHMVDAVNSFRKNGEETLDNVAKLSNDMSGKIKDVLGVEIDRLSATSERTVEMQRDIAEKVGDISKVAEKACTEFSSVRDMLSQQVINIGTVANDAAGKLDAVNARLGQQAGRIGETAAHASGALDMASGRLSGELAAIRETTGEAERRIITITGRFADEVGNLRNTVQKTESDLDTLMSQFARRGGDISELAQNAANNISSVVERLESASGTITTAVDQSVTKISLVNTSLDERVGMVRTAAERAAADLRQAIDDLRMRIAGMEQAPVAVVSKFGEMHRQLTEQIDDINSLTDRMGLRIDSMGSGVETRIGRLTTILHETSNNLADAGTRVQDYLDEMVKGAEINQDRVRDLGNSLRVEAERFVELGNSSVEKINNAVASLRQGVNHISVEAAQQIDKLDDVRMGIASQSSQFVNATDTVLIRIGQIDAKMQEQRLSFTSAYDSTLNRLEDSTISLGIRLQELGDRTQRVVKSLEGAGSAINQQAEQLLDAARTVQSTSSDAADSYRRQVVSLVEASKDAAEQAKIIRQNELDNKRDAFLSAAKFVIESLHSISVDFTRMIDDDVPEKLWKSFQNGDTAAFTRRLVASKDKIAVDKINDLYKRNSEFRSFVLRYLRQFEEVFGKAINTDHGDLLSSTFMTSDIGKLYMALCQGVGRNPLSGDSLDDDPVQGVA